MKKTLEQALEWAKHDSKEWPERTYTVMDCKGKPAHGTYADQELIKKFWPEHTVVAIFKKGEVIYGQGREGDS